MLQQDVCMCMCMHLHDYWYIASKNDTAFIFQPRHQQRVCTKGRGATKPIDCIQWGYALEGGGLQSCHRGLTSWRSAVMLKSEAPLVVQLGPVGMMEQGTPADVSDSSITSGGGGV